MVRLVRCGVVESQIIAAKLAHPTNKCHLVHPVIPNRARLAEQSTLSGRLSPDRHLICHESTVHLRLQVSNIQPALNFMLQMFGFAASEGIHFPCIDPTKPESVAESAG